MANGYTSVAFDGLRVTLTWQGKGSGAIQSGVIVVIDEVHKIFDCMPSFRSAFDELKQLKQLSCSLLAMSATLTSEQVDMLQTHYIRGGNCITIINSVNRDNLRLQLRRYKRQKMLQCSDDSEEHSEDEEDNMAMGDASTALVATSHGAKSLWAGTVLKLLPMIEGHCTVVYVDFVRDVERVVEHFCSNGVKAVK